MGKSDEKGTSILQHKVIITDISAAYEYEINSFFGGAYLTD